jgi:SepF-like predicted cell division protein (DUF552 family)
MEAQQGGVRMTMIHEEKPDLEDYILEHYGVMGMKWGVRRSQAALDRAAGRVRTASRARDSDINEARKKSPKLEKKVKTKKSKYKEIKKHTKRSDDGRKAAKAALKKARVERAKNWDVAEQDTAAEAGARLLADLGARLTNQSDFKRIMAQEAAVARVRNEKK